MARGIQQKKPLTISISIKSKRLVYTLRDVGFSFVRRKNTLFYEEECKNVVLHGVFFIERKE